MVKAMNVHLSPFISGYRLQLISGETQGSILGTNLFNCFFNDFYYFIKNANVSSFADHNTLPTLAQNV